MSRPLYDRDGEQTEAVLRQLIPLHGIETVLEHFKTIYGRGRHADYMRLANLIENVNNQLNRKENNTTQYEQT